MAPAPLMQLSWRTAHGHISLDRPLLAGILNVTPDSFWDGGRHTTVEAAVRHAEALLEQGAGILDIGGESTRPGARTVTAAEEIARVVPVVDALVRRWPHVPISVDTVKSDVARAALAAGAAIINDVSGLRLGRALAKVVADHGAGIVLMHSRGGVENMASYDLAEYGADVVAVVRSELEQAVARARDAGVAESNIVLDPGLGFAKRTEHSLVVLAQLPRLVELGLPVLIGPSRKRFVGETAGGLPPDQRLEGTIAACVIALLHGVRLFRVHDVTPVRRALLLAEAVLHAGEVV